MAKSNEELQAILNKKIAEIAELDSLNDEARFKEVSSEIERILTKSINAKEYSLASRVIDKAALNPKSRQRLMNIIKYYREDLESFTYRATNLILDKSQNNSSYSEAKSKQAQKEIDVLIDKLLNEFAYTNIIKIIEKVSSATSSANSIRIKLLTHLSSTGSNQGQSYISDILSSQKLLDDIEEQIYFIINTKKNLEVISDLFAQMLKDKHYGTALRVLQQSSSNSKLRDLLVTKLISHLGDKSTNLDEFKSIVSIDSTIIQPYEHIYPITILNILTKTEIDKLKSKKIIREKFEQIIEEKRNSIIKIVKNIKTKNRTISNTSAKTTSKSVEKINRISFYQSNYKEIILANKLSLLQASIKQVMANKEIKNKTNSIKQVTKDFQKWYSNFYGNKIIDKSILNIFNLGNEETTSFIFKIFPRWKKNRIKKLVNKINKAKTATVKNALPVINIGNTKKLFEFRSTKLRRIFLENIETSTKALAIFHIAREYKIDLLDNISQSSEKNVISWLESLDATLFLQIVGSIPAGCKNDINYISNNFNKMYYNRIIENNRIPNEIKNYIQSRVNNINVELETHNFATSYDSKELKEKAEPKLKSKTSNSFDTKQRKDKVKNNDIIAEKTKIITRMLKLIYGETIYIIERLTIGSLTSKQAKKTIAKKIELLNSTINSQGILVKDNLNRELRKSQITATFDESDFSYIEKLIILLKQLESTIAEKDTDKLDANTKTKIRKLITYFNDYRLKIKTNLAVKLEITRNLYARYNNLINSFTQLNSNIDDIKDKIGSFFRDVLSIISFKEAVPLVLNLISQHQISIVKNTSLTKSQIKELDNLLFHHVREFREDNTTTFDKHLRNHKAIKAKILTSNSDDNETKEKVEFFYSIEVNYNKSREHLLKNIAELSYIIKRLKRLKSNKEEQLKQVENILLKIIKYFARDSVYLENELLSQKKKLLSNLKAGNTINFTINLEKYLEANLKEKFFLPRKIKLPLVNDFEFNYAKLSDKEIAEIIFTEKYDISTIKKDINIINIVIENHKLENVIRATDYSSISFQNKIKTMIEYLDKPNALKVFNTIRKVLLTNPPPGKKLNLPLEMTTILRKRGIQPSNLRNYEKLNLKKYPSQPKRDENHNRPKNNN